MSTFLFLVSIKLLGFFHMEEPLCDEDDILVAPGDAAVDSSTYLKEETFISNDIVERYDDDAPQVEHYSEVGSESGVEPDYTEWIFDDAASEAGVLFDLSNEQAMATLKYFSKFNFKQGFYQSQLYCCNINILFYFY